MSDNKVDVVIVGAGFAGMYLAYRLRELGLSMQGFEKADDAIRCAVVSASDVYATLCAQAMCVGEGAADLCAAVEALVTADESLDQVATDHDPALVDALRQAGTEVWLTTGSLRGRSLARALRIADGVITNHPSEAVYLSQLKTL